MSQHVMTTPAHGGGPTRQARAASSSGARAADGPALLVAGVVLGALGDVLLRASGPLGVNMFLWVASVALAALAVARRAGVALGRGRIAWLAIGVVLAAGLAWRDSPALKLLALGSATVAFALAAYRAGAAWVLRAGLTRYIRAWATGAFHAWMAAGLVLVDASRSTGSDMGRAPGWRRARGVARGVVIALPLLVVFGGLFMAADAVFANLVLKVLRVDFELVASHVVLFVVFAWLATGYLRGFLRGTELPPLRHLWRDSAPATVAARRPTLGITEVATALAALDILFLLFVLVQFRYLFSGDVLVQVTAGLSYADYARRGFFELVFAVALVVPLLLAADWLLDRRVRHATLVFRILAGVQIALVLAIATSAFQRLRLYHASYGLTEARFYAMVLLLWIGAMLLWLGATVLRGRREWFAFGALVSGLATLALLFVVNPDVIIARTNVARMSSQAVPVRFDVVYATSLSADAVPVLIEALPALPADAQCPLAQHMLQRWAPDRERPMRTWSWSAARASDAVREHEARLKAAVGPAQECTAPTSG